jgi:hypothetical protein
MPTCGFIRVQPDGMKEKDLGNRQRYDPVSKRMITTNPEIPPISNVTLSISQPVFVGDVFKSDYTVTFQGYTGCLNYGKEVTCSIYDQTGEQTATVNAEITSGLNTLVLNGRYTPGGYIYYATLQYGLSTFNSSPTQIDVELSFLSDLSLTLSDTRYNEVVQYGFFSFSDTFYWTGTFNINFVSSLQENSILATYTITNTSNPSVVLATGTHTPSYGNNSIVASPIQFITTPSEGGRNSVPYNTTETFVANINFVAQNFPVPALVFRPTLIRDPVLTFTDSYWTGESLRANFTLNYYSADNTDAVNSAFSFEERTTIHSDGPKISVFGDIPERLLLFDTHRFLFSPRPGNNSYDGIPFELPLPYNPTLTYYGVVTYADPSFANEETVQSPRVSTINPEFERAPVLEISDPYAENGQIYASFTVEFIYIPRNGELVEFIQCVLVSLENSGSFDVRIINNPRVGFNSVILENVPVTPGGRYSVSLIASGIGSASQPVICPNFDILVFTSVPSTVFTIDYTGTVRNFDITLIWNNTIPGSNRNVTIELLDISDGAPLVFSYSPTTALGASYTFSMNPYTLTGNVIEQSLATYVQTNGGFDTIRFKLTDVGTGLSIISSRIGVRYE